MEDSTADIAQMLGSIDPWYERNVLNLLSLSSDVLCQVPSVLASSPFSLTMPYIINRASF